MYFTGREILGNIYGRIPQAASKNYTISNRTKYYDDNNDDNDNDDDDDDYWSEWKEDIVPPFILKYLSVSIGQ